MAGIRDAQHRRHGTSQLQSLLVSQGTDSIEELGHRDPDIELLEAELDSPGFDLGEVQDVVDQG